MKRYKWTVEIVVDETWVEDGFDLRRYNGLTGNDAAHERMAALLPYALGHEFAAKVLSGPPDEDIAKAQGYAGVEAWRKAG